MYQTECGQTFDVRLAHCCCDVDLRGNVSAPKWLSTSHLASVRLPSTWPAMPRRQGDGQPSSPPASASAPSNPPANVKTVELAKTIRTYA